MDMLRHWQQACGTHSLCVAVAVRRDGGISGQVHLLASPQHAVAAPPAAVHLRVEHGSTTSSTEGGVQSSLRLLKPWPSQPLLKHGRSACVLSRQQTSNVFHIVAKLLLPRASARHCNCSTSSPTACLGVQAPHLVVDLAGIGLPGWRQAGALNGKPSHVGDCLQDPRPEAAISLILSAPPRGCHQPGRNCAAQPMGSRLHTRGPKVLRQCRKAVMAWHQTA